MAIVVDCCVVIDVHKRTVVVCRLTRDARGRRVAQTQTFGTTTGELLRLADWLAEGGCCEEEVEAGGSCVLGAPTYIYGLRFATLGVTTQVLRGQPGLCGLGIQCAWSRQPLDYGRFSPYPGGAARADGDGAARMDDGERGHGRSG